MLCPPTLPNRSVAMLLSVLPDDANTVLSIKTTFQNLIKSIT